MNDIVTNSNSDQWEECPAGELQRVVRRAKNQRRDRIAARSIAAAGLVAICLLGGLLVVQQLAKLRDPLIAGIRCSEVREKLPQFASLQAAKQDQIKSHLAHCEHCRSMAAEMGMQVSEVSHRHLHGKQRPAEVCVNCRRRDAVATAQMARQNPSNSFAMFASILTRLR